MKRLPILLSLVLMSCWVCAQEPLIIAAGAGYKKPLLKLYQAFSELLDESLGRIAMPDPNKAIYGRAAEQFLINSGLHERLAPRLLVLATVPQVSSHLVARSVEAGFINLTDALALRERIGGYSEVSMDQYEPIRIVAAVVKGESARQEVRQFIDFLASPDSRDLLREAGL
ncbi:MAG: molybdate ABC transporter substrate-binding protein [Candidatus Thiodiazotropha sp.]